MKLNIVKILIVGMLVFGMDTVILGHGYINSPQSRSSTQANNIGSTYYDRQSIEGLKGFPQAGPSDGTIPSGELSQFNNLNEQSEDRWQKTNINQGSLDIEWVITAQHATTKVHYYITVPNWNPNAPITRDDLQYLTSFNYGGSMIPRGFIDTIDIPTTHTGYHVILGVWDVADTPNAFYQVVDVNILGDGSVSNNNNNSEGNVSIIDETDNENVENDIGDLEASDDSEEKATCPNHQDVNVENETNTTEHSSGVGSNAQQFRLGNFVSPVVYVAGTIVQYDNIEYVVLQTHANFGDGNWAPGIAHALFSRID